MRDRAFLVCFVVLAGCASEPADPDPMDGPPADASGYAEWIEGGYYLGWKCEAEPHPAAGPSPHGGNRICQNELVTGALGGSGAWPVGAALVKEQYDGAGGLFAISIGVRRSAAAGREGWYYWRRELASGGVLDNPAFCADCHQGSPRDFVFSTMP